MLWNKTRVYSNTQIILKTKSLPESFWKPVAPFTNMV